MEFGYKVGLATQADAGSIAKLVNTEYDKTKAVLPLTEKEVGEWIGKGWVAVARKEGGEVIGCQAVTTWPISGWHEFRSSVVKEEERGKGISMELKKYLLDMVHEKEPGAIFVGLKNEYSKGQEVLKSLGFAKVSTDQIPQHVKEEILTVGHDQVWQWYVLGYTVASQAENHELVQDPLALKNVARNTQ